MFFQKELEHRIFLAPEYFSSDYKKRVQRKLRAEVEGTCHGSFGFIVAVLSSHDSLEEGKIDENSGYAVFNIKYEAIVLKPFVGEIMDVSISTISKMGIFSSLGPLSIFISSHLLPDNMKFNPSLVPPCFISDDQTRRITKDDHLRLKIVGVKIDISEIFAIGTIKEDYLGVIESQN